MNRLFRTTTSDVYKKTIEWCANGPTGFSSDGRNRDSRWNDSINNCVLISTRFVFVEQTGRSAERPSIVTAAPRTAPAVKSPAQRHRLGSCANTCGHGQQLMAQHTTAGERPKVDDNAIPPLFGGRRPWIRLPAIKGCWHRPRVVRCTVEFRYFYHRFIFFFSVFCDGRVPVRPLESLAERKFREKKKCTRNEKTIFVLGAFVSGFAVFQYYHYTNFDNGKLFERGNFFPIYIVYRVTSVDLDPADNAAYQISIHRRKSTVRR